MTYGRAFLVGLLNTLLVAGFGIVLATMIGFIVGIARLSTNWLVARLATVYVEVIRNVPPLLQLFFWYFAVLKSLPGPRQSYTLPGGGFFNVRGLYLPAPVPQPGFDAVWLALVIGIVASIAVYLVARRRQMLTGQQFPGAVDLAGADRADAARRVHLRSASRSASTIPSSRASTSRAAW